MLQTRLRARGSGAPTLSQQGADETLHVLEICLGFVYNSSHCIVSAELKVRSSVQAHKRIYRSRLTLFHLSTSAEYFRWAYLNVVIQRYDADVNLTSLHHTHTLPQRHISSLLLVDSFLSSVQFFS